MSSWNRVAAQSTSRSPDDLVLPPWSIVRVSAQAFPCPDFRVPHVAFDRARERSSNSQFRSSASARNPSLFCSPPPKVNIPSSHRCLLLDPDLDPTPERGLSSPQQTPSIHRQRPVQLSTFRACLKIPLGQSARDFGRSQAGLAGASLLRTMRAVTAKPTQAPGKRPAECPGAIFRQALNPKPETPALPFAPPKTVQLSSLPCLVRGPKNVEKLSFRPHWLACTSSPKKLFRPPFQHFPHPQTVQLSRSNLRPLFHFGPLPHWDLIRHSPLPSLRSLRLLLRLISLPIRALRASRG